VSDAHVVVHLHCYQPPRDDAWTGAVPVEPSAAPAHDWNERVTDECYRPLSAARLLDDAGRIVDAVNLYADVSVDVGATLHRWIAVHAPDVDAAIRTSARDAMALPYVHAILPLASARDRTTLVRWGIADFRRRFARDPEGMWLPEAAVDLDTLECLAAEGLRYTILGQHQATRVRVADGTWADAADRLDPARLHLVRLASGRSLTVCFYDGPSSHAIAFDRSLLADGTRLAQLLAARVREAGPQALVLVATDGETFGHHHRFGEMALVRALHDLAHEPGIAVGGLAAFVGAHADTAIEVEVASPSAWSCAHGVERWRAGCGDVTGGEPGWNQRWRAPLRAMVDRLIDAAAEAYGAAAAELVDDPWAVRDGYGAVIDDDLATRERFARACLRDPDADPGALPRLLGLLELQRHALLAQSSCAWFFADCAGIETALTLHHAARTVELVRTLTGADLDAEMESTLAPMVSNEAPFLDGTALWRAAVASALTPPRLAAWWAAAAAFGAPVERIGRVRFVAAEGDAAVTVVDEATGTGTVVPLSVHRSPAGLAIDAAGVAHSLADLPRDALAPLVAAVVDAALAEPDTGIPDLAIVVGVLGDALGPSVRWRAQNAVLAARDRPDVDVAWLEAWTRAADALGVAR
jgi:hypothetical protein